MTEPKSQDKIFSFPLKQETYETYNWTSIENDLDDYKNSNSFVLSKFKPPTQLFNDFNPLTLNNQELNNESMSLFNQNMNQNFLNEPGDQSIRNNSTFPIFNDKLLVNSNANMEMNPSTINKYSLDVMNNFKQVQTFQQHIANYFPFSVD